MENTQRKFCINKKSLIILYAFFVFLKVYTHMLKNVVEDIIILIYTNKAKRNLLVGLLACLFGTAGHALYGMSPCFGHTGVTQGALAPPFNFFGSNILATIIAKLTNVGIPYAKS